MADELVNFALAGQTSVANALLMHYRTLGLSEVQLVACIQLLSITATDPDGNVIGTLAERMHQSEENAAALVYQLTQAKIVQLTAHQNANHQQADRYDFTPLYRKLGHLLAKKQDKPAATPAAKETGMAANDLYQRLEVDLGRPLTPYDVELVQAWLTESHYAPEVIALALKEAVINNVKNLKYMDKILLNWEAKQLKTAEQVKQYQAQLREKKVRKLRVTSTKPQAAATKIPEFDWQKPPTPWHE